MVNPTTSNLKLGTFLLVCLVSAIYLARTTYSGSPITNLFQSHTLQGVEEVCGFINVDDNFTDMQIEKAGSIDRLLYSFRSQNPFIKYAFSDQTPRQFAESYAKSFGPFAFIGAFMFIFGFTTMCCLCFDYKFCRNCVSHKSKTRICYMVLSTICSLALIGGSIFGGYIGKGLTLDYKETACAGAILIGEISSGNQEMGWIGLDSAITSLTEIKDDVQEMLDLLPNVDEAHQDLTNYYNQMEVEIQTLYNNNKDAVVRNPDTSKPSVQPEFIKALGPASSDETVTGLIKQEIVAKYTFLDDGLSEASEIIKDLKDSSSSITHELESGISSARSFNDSVTEVFDGYVKYYKNGERWIGDTESGIVAFFAVSLFFSVLVCVGVLNTFTFKTLFLLKVLKFSRICCLNIVLLIILTITTAIFTASFISMELCNAAEQAFKNETIFHAFGNKLVSDYEESNYSLYTHTCFFGDGDILKHFGVYERLEEFNALFNDVQNFTEFNLSMPDSYVLPAVFSQIELFASGKLPISVEVAEDLVKLNTFTNRNNSTDLYGCSESEDTWLLNSQNCTTSAGTVFKSSDPADYNYGSATCMPFDEYSAYQPSDRYNGKYASCPPQQGVPYADIVMGLVGGFQNHMTDVNTVFGKVQDDLTPINKTNENFMTEAKGLIAPLIEIDHKVMALLELIGNNHTGLISNFNCEVAKTNLKTAIDYMCISTLPDVFLIALTVLFIGALSILVMFPVYYLEKILEKELEDKRRKRLDELLHENEQEHLLLVARHGQGHGHGY